jgi:signal transduction histidine kinase
MYLLNRKNLVSIQNNYHVYHSRLVQLLFQATSAANPIINIAPFEKASSDYNKINKFNQVIFTDIDRNLTTQAQSVLLSNQYKKLRADYNQQIEKASQQIKHRIEAKIQSASYTHDIIAISLLIIIAVFLFSWLFIIRLIGKWKNRLMKVNAALDKKVEKRTKKLIEEIRAHKEAEKQKTKLETVLNQNQKLHSVGILAAGVAHDFNNLLAIMLANAESLDIEKPDNKEAQQGLIEAAQEAGYLTKQLLTFARKSRQIKTNTNLNDLVIKTIHLFERSLPKNITVYHELDKQDIMIEVDANQVTQVMLNIAINAKDALPDGGRIAFKTSIKEQNEFKEEGNQQGPWACLAISDNGTGISPDDLPYIFDPFFTKKEVDKGTGLGLATAYGIMEQHKGSIRAISNENGTEFILLFPMKK